MLCGSGVQRWQGAREDGDKGVGSWGQREVLPCVWPGVGGRAVPPIPLAQSQGLLEVIRCGAHHHPA